MSEVLGTLYDPRIEAVIVLYKCSPKDSITLTSLLHASATSKRSVSILLVDNSPRPGAGDNLSPGVTYLACPENLGLANAYNRAIELYESSGCTWLLTLDQDTNVPADFITKLYAALGRIEEDPSIAAVVPQIVANETIVSPHYFKYGGLPRYLPSGYQGIFKEQIFAFNSAALIRIDALLQAGGYDPLFWLDCSDLRMFQSLGQMGKHVYVAADITVQHSFSMMDMEHSVSAWRYRHILLAEGGFWARYMNSVASMQRILGLTRSLVRQIVRREGAELRRISVRFLWTKLLGSRKHQFAIFQKSVEEHLGLQLEATRLTPRKLKISVAMAAYNGGRFIREQLESILPQLSELDEVIIVDDASTDDTVEQIAALADRRIRVIQRQKNQGLIASFDQAIRSTTGDIIFLSDNDDIWPLDKVALFLAEFEKDTAVNVVTSDLSLIDEHNQPFEDPAQTRGGQFKPGFLRNIVKNAYQGSTMAFRSSLLAKILPLPIDKGFIHDVWIGTVNDRIGGKTAFIPKPLLFYRRHERSLTRRLSFNQQLRLRTLLLLEHGRRSLR